MLMQYQCIPLIIHFYLLCTITLPNPAPKPEPKAEPNLIPGPRLRPGVKLQTSDFMSRIIHIIPLPRLFP